MADPRPTVLFDVDGTLLDSNYLHTLAWSRAIVDGGEWAPMNAIHRLIGMGSDKLLPELIGREDEEMAEFWKSHYEALMVEVRPFPGAAALLRTVASSGAAVVLATSSPGEHVAFMTDLLGVGDAIAATTSSGDVENSKPAPDIFLTAMSTVAGDPSCTIVVGDSRWDVEAATAARLPCVAVESGGFSEAELTAAGAVAVYRNVETLHRELASSPIGEIIRRA